MNFETQIMLRGEPEFTITAGTKLRMSYDDDDDSKMRISFSYSHMLSIFF